jgi:hypothetical protein
MVGSLGFDPPCIETIVEAIENNKAFNGVSISFFVFYMLTLSFHYCNLVL